MRLSAWLLRSFGWKVDITIPDMPKLLVCVAPHTSNWDFIIGKLAYASIGRKAGFIMKSSWFFFPLGLFFKSIGGIPVNRGKGSSLVEAIAEKFKTLPRMTIAITPEGTRSRVSNWHTGFLRIAALADVPIALGILDYAHKRVVMNELFYPTGNIEADLQAVKTFYRESGCQGRYPSKFSTD